jgi:hypothetical protein
MLYIVKLRQWWASLGCGELSVGGEVANRVTLIGIRDSAVLVGV